MTKTMINLGDRTIPLTNLHKPLWSNEGVTKWDLISYYARVGPVILPHLKDRPLTVVRFPDGIEGHGFYQKDAPNHMPEWIETYRAGSDEGVKGTRYILANDVPTLVWLANQAAIELHPWMSRIQRPDYPDYAVIDLDPGEGAGFEEARSVARLAKGWLDRIGLVSVPKTSGATGIHIMVPIDPVYTYEVTSKFVGLIARLMETEAPAQITTERKVKKRPPGTVYVDHLQNLRGKTIVAPYSPRPRPGAPVSTPFAWEELPEVRPEMFTVKVPDRVLHYAEAYRETLSRRQRLEDALATLRRYVGGNSV